MALLPSVDWLLSVLAAYGVYLMVSISLNLEYGYAGLPNFGKTLAIAAGAFVAGFLPGRLIVALYNIAPGQDYVANSTQIVSQINQSYMQNPAIALGVFGLTLGVAAIVGVAVAFLAYVPTAKLREDFLAMTLLAIAEVFRIFGQNYTPLAGGTLGIQVPDPFAWASPYRFLVITVAIVGIACAVFIFAELEVRSPLGRALRALRDQEVAAKVAGKDVVMMRLKMFCIASAIAAVAGTVYAFYAQSAIAAAYTRVDWTFWVWLMVMIGGSANNRGVALGTGAFVILDWLIIFYKGLLRAFVPFDPTWLEYLLLGSSLIAFLLFRPQGIIGEKPIKTIDFKGLWSRNTKRSD